MNNRNDQVTAPAPPCAPWCTRHTPGKPSWDIDGRDPAKICRVCIEATQDVDGEPVTVEVERVATVDAGCVTVEPTGFRIIANAALTVAGALMLSETLQRAAELVSASSLVA